MTLKSLVVGILAVCRLTAAGVISLEGDPHHSFHHHHHEHHDPHVSVASSFMHFHGPVEGPAFEVKVPYVVHHTSEHNHLSEGGHEEEHGLHHDHHGYAIDYVAHPKYEYSYGVEDHHTGDFHGQKETRDGSSVTGEYSVMEPGGRMRVVTYRADKDGFHAVVHHSGKNDHSGATYTPEATQQHEGHQHHVHEAVQGQAETSNHELQQYTGYGTHEGYN